MSADKLAQALRDLLSYAAENDPGQGDPERDDPRITAASEALAAHQAQQAQQAGRADAQPVEPTDTQMLDWLETQRAAYGFQDLHEGNTWSVDGPFATARDAMRAAMLAARAEKGGT